MKFKQSNKKSILTTVMLGALALLAIVLVSCQATQSEQVSSPTPEPTEAVSMVLPTDTPTVVPVTIAEPSLPTPIPTSTPSPTPSPTATSTPSPTPSPTATSTPSPAPSPTPIPSPTSVPPTLDPAESPTTAPITLPPAPPPPGIDLTPGQPQPYLNHFRLVTYYGSPLGWGLGVLGQSARHVMLGDLRRMAAQYQQLSPDRFVMPTYHIVSTVADQQPERYSHRIDSWFPDTLVNWINHAEQNGVAVILDLQPGRADPWEEFLSIREFLYRPHVHMALDPEFVMVEGQIPSIHLGQMYADKINQIQEGLNQIGSELGLNKVLILHQFEDSMLPDKGSIGNYPFVDLVIDADGFGGSYSKISDYNQYANEPPAARYLGMKLFAYGKAEYNDPDLLSPGGVMSLSPQPSVIIYQ